MGQVFGYARVSTEDQSCDLQVDALITAGATKIVQEKVSGAKKDKPLLTKLLAKLQSGDSLIIWKLDRLGRNAIGLLQLIEEFEVKNIRLVITTLGLDTSGSAGKLMLGMLAQIAEFERTLIVERVNAGIQAAKDRGVHLGRKHTLTPQQRREATTMIDNGRSYAEVASVFACGRSVVFRAVSEVRAKA